jgi:hypothetical protein
MTLAQFKAATAPSLTIRQEIEATESHLKSLHTERGHADEVMLPKVQQVINGVPADPEEGPDSALYEALGYNPPKRTTKRTHTQGQQDDRQAN